MYKKFFGLQENPFNVNPDPRYLYMTGHAQEALACLTYGIQNRKGFVLLTGEVGTGKTTLLNKLLDWLHRERIPTAFVFNPRLNVTQFLDFMMADFGLPCDPKMKSQTLLKFNHWLLERHRAGETAVLVVDEAQNLSPQVMEEIRLLTNLESGAGKLLTFALFGQPELLGMLARQELRALADRVTHHFRLHPLRGDEVAAYVQFRLHAAGHRGGRLFEPAAERRLARRSGGRSRRINLLADRALLACYARGGRVVTARDVARSERDLGLRPAPRVWTWLQRVLARPPRPLEVR